MPIEALENLSHIIFTGDVGHMQILREIRDDTLPKLRKVSLRLDDSQWTTEKNYVQSCLYNIDRETRHISVEWDLKGLIKDLVRRTAPPRQTHGP